MMMMLGMIMMTKIIINFVLLDVYDLKILLIKIFFLLLPIMRVQCEEWLMRAGVSGAGLVSVHCPLSPTISTPPLSTRMWWWSRHTSNTIKLPQSGHLKLQSGSTIVSTACSFLLPGFYLWLDDLVFQNIWNWEHAPKIIMKSSRDRLKVNLWAQFKAPLLLLAPHGTWVVRDDFRNPSHGNCP